MQITEHDLEELRQAKLLLENPGIAAKMANVLGKPMGSLLQLLPDVAQKQVTTVVNVAMTKAVKLAITSMDVNQQDAPSNWWHKVAVATTGGISGFFGIAALAVELPISTTIMMRSIADIARSEGEFVTELDTQLACLSVFAMGGGAENGADNSYYALRQVLTSALNEASQYIAEKGFAETAPAVIRLIATVANRFGIQVSEKLVVQALPLIGAAGGAIVNTLFMDHFQDMAKGHFVVRRLERKYGEETIKNHYLNTQ